MMDCDMVHVILFFSAGFVYIFSLWKGNARTKKNIYHDINPNVLSTKPKTPSEMV